MAESVAEPSVPVVTDVEKLPVKMCIRDRRGREILPAFQHQLVRPLRKALENQLKQFGYPLCAGAVISLWRQGRKPAEQRGNIGDERADAVDDSPRKPNTLEPVPCLISLLLVIGQLGSDHRDRGHKAGQHGADVYKRQPVSRSR